MSVNFSFNGNTLYQSVSRDFKELQEEELKKEQELFKKDKTKYQDMTVTDSNGNKTLYKTVTFRDAKNGGEFITIRLTEDNMDRLKDKFKDSKFIEMENGATRILGDAEEFISSWFEDVKYNRGFSNKGADFKVEYGYFEQKLNGSISDIDVKMTEQYMNLGKMKMLAQNITEFDLKGLTKEQKIELDEEIKKANIMTEYYLKYISIFEADGGKNLTDELNTTLRIDENFDGKVDLNENFKRDKKSDMTVQKFFTGLVEDFNKKYGEESFMKGDFEKDSDIDFMSFADKIELLNKINKMKSENSQIKGEVQDISTMYDEAMKQKDEARKDAVADMTSGGLILEQNWEIAIDLLFGGKTIDKTQGKKEHTAKDEIQDNLKERVEDSIQNSLNELGIIDYQQERKTLASISSVYDKLYYTTDIANFVSKLNNEYESVEDYELNTQYNVNYSEYLGTQEFLMSVVEYANKRDYSAKYVASKEFQKEFFDIYNDPLRAPIEFGTFSAYAFARNLVRAKEQDVSTWKVKFEAMRDEYKQNGAGDSNEFKILTNLLKDLESL